MAVEARVNPPHLDSIEDYRRRFADPAYWRPYVGEVCHHHGLAQGEVSPKVGVPGTYPVFIVDHRWVIKFFGRLFNGGAVFRSELEANRIVSGKLEVPIPPLVAHGSLFGDTAEWSWPYLVFEFLPDDSLSHVRDEVSLTNMMSIAEELGHIVSRLHSLPLPDGSALRPTWDHYTRLLESGRAGCEQRHREWGDLPGRMLSQVEAFIPSAKDLVPRAGPPTLLHGDLTADHILVRRVGSVWRIRALIDFGDAIAGDPLFELIAPHLDIFHINKELLRVFMHAYQPSLHLDHIQAQKLLCLCLLHPYNVFPGFFQEHPEAVQLTSLADLASWLWRIET